MQKQKQKKRGLGAFFAFLGLMISPIMWWNDLVINLPMAFVFAYVVGFVLSLVIPVNLTFFLVLIGIGYFLSNVIGFLLMEKGVDLYRGKSKFVFNWKKNLLYSALTVFLVVLSIQIGLLDLAETQKLMASVLKVSYLK